MPVIFGYGSLINPRSAEKTLGRSLCSHQMGCVTLADYVRSWTAPDCVSLQIDEQIQPCDALFLDLTAYMGQSCSGVAIEVCERELRMLDIREKGYERCPVSLKCSEGKTIRGYAYIMPEAEKLHQGIILARYKQMIDEALQAYPSSFSNRFWRDTLPSKNPVIEGEYVFADCEQNIAAGRSLIKGG